MDITANLEFILLFDQITFLGKVSNVVKKVNEDIKVEKFFDIQQLLTQDLEQDNIKYILISETEYLMQLEDYDINPEKFSDIICIDEEDSQLSFSTVFINKKTILTGLMTKVNDLIKSYLPVGNYIPINYKNFVKGMAYPCDLFIKLNTDKYVKVLTENTEIESEFIQKYLEKEIHFFYIESEKYDDFSQTVFKKKTIVKKREQEIDASINAVEALHTYAKELGFGDQIIKQTQQLHQHIEKNANSKVLKNLLNRLKNLEGTFLYNHSFVTATLALTIGKKFNWFTFENQEKVYLGSMLHDLGYKDEKNAFHELMDKDEIEKLEQSKRDDILNHTTRYNEQLTKTNLHQDVINIIIRHHGAQGAGSYPRNVSPHEATLIFALFMISHDFTLRLFKASFNKNKIPEIINDMESTYKIGNYKTIYPEFVKSVREIFLDVN